MHACGGWLHFEILQSDWTAIFLQQNKSGYRACTRPSVSRRSGYTRLVLAYIIDIRVVGSFSMLKSKSTILYKACLILMVVLAVYTTVRQPDFTLSSYDSISPILLYYLSYNRQISIPFIRYRSRKDPPTITN